MQVGKWRNAGGEVEECRWGREGVLVGKKWRDADGW